MALNIAKLIYDMQVKHAAWIVKRVALNIGCDFDGMMVILREELKDEKW